MCPLIQNAKYCYNDLKTKKKKRLSTTDLYIFDTNIIIIIMCDNYC